MNKLISVIFTMFCFLVTISNADAGFFGPSNASECVLEKMKGQDRSLLGTARAACAEQYPVEEALVENEHYKKGQIAYSWCDTAADSITVCLDTKGVS